jgi:replicative DNA helicase
MANKKIREPYVSVPKHNDEHEAKLLGMVIADRENLVEAIQIIPNEQVFYREKHRLVWKNIVEMWGKGMNVDLITLSDYLTRKGAKKQLGEQPDYWLTHITTLVDYMHSIGDVCRIAVEHYMARQIHSLGVWATSRGRDPGVDVFQHLDEIQKRLYGITAGIHTGGLSRS